MFEIDCDFDKSQDPIELTNEVDEQGMEEPVHYEFDCDIDDDGSISGKEDDLETWMDDDVL